MTVRTTAGTTLKISAGLPSTFDAAGFNALSFTQVGEVTNIGDFGREYALVTHEPIDIRATIKKKGNFNSGSIDIALGLDENDAGQIIMQAALLSDNDYSILITDKAGVKYYFCSQVMKFKKSPGAVNNIFGASTTLEVTANATGADYVKA